MNNFVSAEQINQLLSPIALVDKLQLAFASDITTPLRQHFDIPNPYAERETTLLMMPSWHAGEDIGVKLVTVVPDSYRYDLPSIQGVYVLIDAVKGSVKSIMDAPALTAKRTAAASALASRFMSREDASVLTMVGTGTLAPELIKAHCAVRPIKQVNIWGRKTEKAEQLKNSLSNVLDVELNVIEDLSHAVKVADIISCATLSQTPLIKGAWLQAGQHLDLVGAYRPDMREADDDCILKSHIVVDNYQGAFKETGDIKMPLDAGILQREKIVADLFELCRKERVFTRNRQDISLFKSVGHALEDLAAAQLVLESINNQI